MRPSNDNKSPPRAMRMHSPTTTRMHAPATKTRAPAMTTKHHPVRRRDSGRCLLDRSGGCPCPPPATTTTTLLVARCNVDNDDDDNNDACATATTTKHHPVQHHDGGRHLLARGERTDCVSSLSWGRASQQRQSSWKESHHTIIKLTGFTW